MTHNKGTAWVPAQRPLGGPCEAVSCIGCRLVEFSVIDGSEQQQPLETHGVRETELFLSGNMPRQYCKETCALRRAS